MIITKTPFRVSFCGGGSDLPSFYREYGGCVLSTTINKYMYLSIHPYFDSDTTVLKYSKTEIVKNYDEIDHKIFAYALKSKSLKGVEITSTADIPAGTGLGSSSSFTVGLLNTINSYFGKYSSKENLANNACDIEIEKLGAPIGKQDQYAASFGGLNFIKFNKDDTVSVEPIIMNYNDYKKLQDNLMMFYTGDIRSANSILSEQNSNMKKSDKIENVKRLCELTVKMKDFLQSGNLKDFGNSLNEGWELKKTLASGIANPFIDEKYEIALKNGALGGKLLGAGGGGFLLFYCEKEYQENLRKEIGLKELEFRFDHDGTSVIFVGDKYWD